MEPQIREIMNEKLNRVVTPTIKNIFFILLSFILPQIVIVVGVIVNDHYAQNDLERHQNDLQKTLEKKADAQDLAEYIKLDKAIFDLHCQMDIRNMETIQMQINKLQTKQDELERRIFEQSRVRGSIDSSYFLYNGLSVMMDAGVFPGDYCKSKKIGLY